MVRSHLSVLKPIVFQLAAALEQYQADFETLLKHRFDSERCRAVIRELAEIQSLSAALPQLAADTLEVVARHVELLGLLLRRSTALPGVAGPVDWSELQSTHRTSVDAMRVKCLRLLSAQKIA